MEICLLTRYVKREREEWHGGKNEGKDDARTLLARAHRSRTPPAVSAKVVNLALARATTTRPRECALHVSGKFCVHVQITRSRARRANKDVALYYDSLIVLRECGTMSRRLRW